MVIKYDKETDIVYIKLTDNPVAESDEGKQGVIIDYDEKENIVGIEILNASSKVIQPNGMIYEIA